MKEFSNRVVVVILVFVFIMPFKLTAQDISEFNQEINFFIKKYVKEGNVFYDKIKKEEVQKIKDKIAKIDFTALPLVEQKAYLINVYNLLVINAVKEDYPIASPKEITGFFDWKKYTIGRKKFTLNEFEKETLLQKFEDPRLHFTLVCAAKSCPPITSAIYTAEQLEYQLNEQTTKAVNDTTFIYLNKSEKTVYLNEIFRWYADDFKVSGGIRAFINQYRKVPIPPSYKIRYYKYEWLLNDANPVKRSGNPAFFRASRLLRKHQFELKIFNSLYTQKQFDGFEQVNSRSSYFSSFIQYLHGSNKRYNLGVDFVIRSQVVNDLVANSPFKAIHASNFDEYRTNANDTLRNSQGLKLQTTGRFGLSHIGPKIKFHPFKNNRNISFQQTFYIPLDKNVDGSTISFSQLFYDKLIGTRTQLFAELSLWTPIAPTFRVGPFLKVFYSYFPTNRWTIYGMVGLPSEIGVGTKYLVAKNFEIELLYTNYALQRVVIKDRIAQTFNVGLRFMR